jgi:SanA protein
MKRRCLKCATWSIVGVFALTAILNLCVVFAGRSRVYTDIERVPKRNVAVVLGTDLIRRDGSTNVHFLYRVDSAARVYLAGKANTLLVSGSKNNKGFNEVLGMQRALLARGIPAQAILLDFEGSRTFESARRGHETFHLQKVLIITDDFHAARSIFLFHHFGIDAVAFCSGTEPLGYWYARYRIREYFARVKAVMDTIF